MAEEEDRIPMIGKVRIKHFRSIEDAEFTLEPLTVLVGPNASGKSNVVDALGFLGDIARDGLESAVSRRGGIDAIGWRSPTGRVHAPELQCDFSLSNAVVNYRFELARKPKGSYVVNAEAATAHRVRAGSSRRKVSGEVMLQGGKLVKPSPPEAKESVKDKLRRIDQRLSKHSQKALALMPSHLSPVLLSLSVLLNNIGLGPGGGLRARVSDAEKFARGVCLYHVFPNALRQPQRMTDSHPLLPDASNLASALNDILHREDSFAEDIKDCLAVAVPGIQDIRVSTAGSHQVIELKHVPPLSGRYLGDREMGAKQKGVWFDLVHEADGTIRLLALLTALYQQPSPSMICLEEPEVGIHPGALGVIRDVLQEAPLRSQVVVTTHSPDLIGMLPVEGIRAVSAESGSTKVGPIAGHQIRSVQKKLFNAGEIHNIEGLHPELAIGEPVC